MQFVTSRSEALDKLNKYIENDISNYNSKRNFDFGVNNSCLLYTSPSPRDKRQSRMPSSA